KSILNTLPTPDEGARTIRTGRARMEGSTTEVPVRVTVGGAGVSTKLHFREEDNQWRVFAISASFPDGEKTLDFEIPNTPGERVDPLKALVGTKFELSG